ncbi:FAD/NAD-P-binding domain-containing protein [Mycena belliarum]|uniref:FAD/NAD-P-binding domain-containing protein n=1 Tax=Mycena belliarum TaxID=1033014 RepID=A0AAD6TUD3_9AGAR|nr:FAD/NAD-P-binding domain-containing protein [Mycena belliae]
MILTVGLIALSVATLPAFAEDQSPLTSHDDDAQWTTFHGPIQRVAVIGAGPAGLQAAAHLLASNFSVRLFERAPAPGGNWFYTEAVPVREPYPDESAGSWPAPPRLPATNYYSEGDDELSLDERWREHWRPRPMWEDLSTKAPATHMALPGVQYPVDTPWSVPVHDVQRHVRAYASMHGLNTNDSPRNTSAPSVTSYATRVEHLEKSNTTSTWWLTLRRLHLLAEPSRIREDFWQEEFDAVVVATGLYCAPHVPDIAGIEDWSKAKRGGRWSVNHAQVFRRPEGFAGKTVLIVGASVSATDIARRISPFVKRLVVSTRPNPLRDALGLDILLRWPSNAEIVPEIAAFEPLGRFDEGISAGRIRLVNGTLLDGIDEILLATGYKRSIFADRADPATMRNLHWTGHYIDDPTLAYTTAAIPWTHGRYQSAGFTRVWARTARLPSRTRMWADNVAKKYQFGGPLSVFGLEALARLYVAWLNSEALELGGAFIEPMPVENREVNAYFLNAHRKKDGLTHENYTRFDGLPASDWLNGGVLRGAENVW